MTTPARSAWTSTPRYHAALSLKGAQLEEYARTISGRQSYRGNDRRQDRTRRIGQRRAQHPRPRRSSHRAGRLGRAAALCSGSPRVINSVPSISFASDREEPCSREKPHSTLPTSSSPSPDGMTTFDPIKFTGNAFSLMGTGTLDPQGYMDLRLNLLWGRDRFHIPLVSDFARRASTPFFIAHVRGTPSNFKTIVEPLPPVGDALRAINRNRGDSQPE